MKRSASFSTRLSNIKSLFESMSRLRLGICIGLIALIIVLLVWLCYLLFFAEQQQPVVANSTLDLAESQSDSFVRDDDFDKDAISKVSSEYEGTLLIETEDAGDEYVANTVFLGDSNTARMISYSSTTGLTMENAIGIESMGITSVTSLRCVSFSGYSNMTMPDAVALMQPQRVVINFGTNNAGMNLENYKNSYKEAIEAIQEEWPYADIIIASVFPITSSCSYTNISMDWIENVNLTLLELASEMDVKFLNWSEAIKSDNTGYAENSSMVSDGIHISESGAEALINYFRTHSFIGEDTRPKPLEDVPTRLPTPEGLFPKPVFTVPDDTSTVQQSSSVSVSVSGSTGGTASGSGSGTAGSSITIGVTVAAAEGYSFSGWSASAGSVSGSSTSITVAIPAGHSGSISVVAIFTATSSSDTSSSISTSSSSQEPAPDPEPSSSSSSQAEPDPPPDSSSSSSQAVPDPPPEPSSSSSSQAEPDPPPASSSTPASTVTPPAEGDTAG